MTTIRLTGFAFRRADARGYLNVRHDQFASRGASSFRAWLAGCSQARQHSAPSSFADLVRDFRAFGKATEERVEGAIPYLVNEFWTAGQRQAHSIHEVSYRACFKPQLPEFFIERLTSLGDAVYDPFMGRGTTPVQAALMGRRAARQ